MINELATILQSNFTIGFLVLLVIIPLYFKLGIFDKLWSGKNGFPKRMDDLEQHFNHEITDTLKRIEERLNDIHDGIVYLKAKVNGQ